MVGVMAHFLQVVVLTAHAEALLRVGGTAPLRFFITQDNVLELVHTGVSKHEGWIVLDYHRSRGHDVVAMLLKVTLEGLSDFFCSQHNSLS